MNAHLGSKILSQKPSLILAILLTSIGPELALAQQQPSAVQLWDDSPVHATTRPHNRKLVYDADTDVFFAFFGVRNEPDGKTRNRWKSSVGGVDWDNGGPAYDLGARNSSGSDAFLESDRIVFTYTDNIDGNHDYIIKTFTIDGDNLIDGTEYTIMSVGTDGIWGFYGSLDKDTDGYYWLAARMYDEAFTDPGEPYATPDFISWGAVVRSTSPNDISSWEPAADIVPLNTQGNTIPDVVALDGGRVVVITKQETAYWLIDPVNWSCCYDPDVSVRTRIWVSLYDPNNGGWQSTYTLLETDDTKAEVSNRVRPVAEFDPQARRLHLIYATPQGHLYQLSLDHPYQPGDWSAKPGELIATTLTTDTQNLESNISFCVDHTTSPASLYAVYLDSTNAASGEAGHYRIRRYDGPSDTWAAQDEPFGPQTSTVNEISMLKDCSHRVAGVFLNRPNSTDNEVLFQEYVPGNGPPVAGFSAATTSGEAPLNVVFTDASSDPDGTIVSWLWVFGDGDTSTAQNPSHTYSDPGSYTVSLTVTDDRGITDILQQDDYISVSHVPDNVSPVADFSAAATSGEAPLNVVFTDASSDPDGTIVSWLWVFGDGDTSTAQNPSHTYSDPGSYTVSLTVTDDRGTTDTLQQDAYISVLEVQSGEPFFEDSGLLVIEAEHYHQHIPRAASSWTLETESVGYSADGYMHALPNSGTQMGSGFETQSPELQYQVQFTNPGTYYLWVRGWAPSSDDDSCHFGLEGSAQASSSGVSWLPVFGGWGWFNHVEQDAVATLNVSTPGLHTINLWMREDGLMVDKLVLTLDASFAPSGAGPRESSRVQPPCDCNGNNPCTDGSCNSDGGPNETPSTTSSAHDTPGLSGGCAATVPHTWLCLLLAAFLLRRVFGQVGR